MTLPWHDLDTPDHTTPEELEAFREYQDQPGRRPLDSHWLWAELRPDVLKRHLNFCEGVSRL